MLENVTTNCDEPFELNIDKLNEAIKEIENLPKEKALIIKPELGKLKIYEITPKEVDYALAAIKLMRDYPLFPPLGDET